MADQAQIPQDPAQSTLIPGSPQQTQHPKKNPTTHSTSLAQAAFSYTASYEAQLKHHAEVAYNITQKYASIDSLDKHKKMEALKNPSLNPYNLADPVDGLANSLHRWTMVGHDAIEKNFKSEDMQKVASNYYDKMIAPLYAKASLQPMAKDLWMKHAYNEGLQYDINDAYSAGYTHQVRQGWRSGEAAGARAVQYIANAEGHALTPIVNAWKTATGQQPWHEMLATQHNDTGVQNPYADLTRRAGSIAEHDQFWADAYPTYDGFLNKTTSFVAEQTAQLPLYVAMGAAGKLGKILSGVSNLTKILTATPAGKAVIPYIMAGSEGLAYGKLTRPENDKAQAWRDAAGFAIFHGVFHIGGTVLAKLTDVAMGKMAERAAKKGEKLDLAKDGKRLANATEEYEAHKKEVANNIIVGGVASQRAIMIAALRHMHDMEASGRTPEQVEQRQMELLRDDPARWAPVFSGAKFIKGVLQGNKLGDMKEGSEQERFLASRIAQLITDAGSELNEHAINPELRAGNEVAKTVKEPGGKKTLDFYKAKVAAKLGNEDPAALKMMKPEQLEALAKKAMTEDSVKAAKIAEQKLNANPVEKATNVAKKAKPEKPIPQLKVRSERTFNKFGEPAVRYSVNADYKVQLANYTKQAKASGQSLNQFFEDMSDEDFNKDLTEHFFPKALKQAEIYFEKQHTPEGNQNPNFLGFMYNYTHTMPKEFGQELERRLVDSMKVQKYMDGKKPTVPQLMYFARAMYNHVDNFLGSGRWPNETNIFRSTQDKMWQSTEWQQQLLREKITQERKNIRDMFSSDPKAQRAALVAHTLLNRERMAQYQKGPADMMSQEYIRMTDNRIADLQTESGDYERIPF